jgi:hypothetical protein
MGLALLTGRSGKPWSARAIRARAFLAGAVGGQPVGTPAKLVEPKAATGQRTLLPPWKRAGAIDAAKDMLDALAIRRFDRLRPLLAEEIWALWPNGNLSKHDRDPLLAELETREGERARIEVTQVRSYTLSELRSVLVRGIADAIDALLDLDASLVVTAQVTGGRGPGGRLMIVMAKGEGGAWQARSLPIGSPDDAHVASARNQEPASEDLGVARELVRHLLLGHGTQLRALAQHIMPTIWVRDQVVPQEALFELADEGPPPVGSTETVFLETREIEAKELSHHVPQTVAAKIRERALEVFAMPYDKLSPRLAATKIGLLDPANGTVEPSRELVCLIVRVKEPSGRLRPRAAGFFV